MFSLQTIESWITQTFNPAIGEYGQDYQVNVGTPIYSPISGTVSTEDKGKQDWGKRVIVFADDTATRAAGLGAFAVGHLTSFAVSSGQHVQAGQLLGYSGGAKSDPSSGDSSGPHVEPQFFGPGTTLQNPIDPTKIFARFPSFESAIFNGIGSGVGSTASSLNPLAGVPEAITAAAGVAARFGWLALGFALFSLGLLLIFFGDVEKVGEKVGDVVEKAAPLVAA